jgi:hypothetical protein
VSLEKIIDELSVDRTWNHIETITEEIPTRLAGSENSHRMAEYALSALDDAGIDGKLHEFLGLVSFPEEGTVKLLAPYEETIPGNTLGHSASTDGIEAELVYVGSGTESEYEGKDVRGKITLSELSYSPARHEKAYVAWKRGSVAQIMMNWGDETNEAIPFGSMKSAWGNPTPETLETELPDIPCIGIARTIGLRLKELCNQGTVRVRVKTQAENGWKPLTMTSGEFTSNQSDQFLLLGGHMDSWFGPQATDNAAGNACMIELSRLFSKYQSDLRRGVVTSFWMGHETGTMISSSRFADTNWDRLRESCVAYMQIDQPAIVNSSVWHLHTTDDIYSYGTSTTKNVIGRMPLHWERQQKNGDASFFGVGLPCISGEMSYTEEELKRTALAGLGWWHHSRENTMDKLDKEKLALHLKVYARWMWGLLTEPILPLSYLPLAQRFVARLDELSKIEAPDIDMQGVGEHARQFEQLATKFDQLCEEWRNRDSGASEELYQQLNATMIQLSRVLVPIASTVVGPYGQDRYGHAWQTQMIPSLAPYGQLGTLDSSSEEFQTLWVSMVRARNRVSDHLKEGSAAIKRTLAEVG